MLLGVDYYPEQWPKDMLEADLDRIVAMGAQAIRIGEFAWHLVETSEGSFDFSFFDHVIARAKARGLKVVYGTPTATFPAWLATRYPEILSVDAQGQRRAFGGRRQYCYNARDYWRLSERMVAKLVAHYRHEESLVLWQLDNELGHEGSDDCYCPQCHADFQDFLRDKYQDIATLNDIYGTIFWGQTYNDFNEIPLPTATITTHNPVLKLDWQRFRSFSIERFASRQLAVIRENAGAHQPVTHNFYGGYFDRRFDQSKVSEGLDFVAYDNYPVWGGLMAPLSPAEISMGHAYMYGLKQQPFWVMEQLIGAQGHDDIGYLPRDGESTLWAAQAMGRGCNSLFYFRYRGATKGQEQFCQGILDADNLENDKYREVQRFYRWCKDWQAVLDQPLKKAPVALVYSYDNRQAWRGQRQSSDFDYTKALLAFYEAFHDINVPVDVITLEKNWQDYPVVLMPVMQMITPSLAKALETYVAKGGVLISGYRAFIKDENNNLPFGQTAPCYLNDLFGMRVTAYEALGEGQQRQAEGATLNVWRDLLKPLKPQDTQDIQDTQGAQGAQGIHAFPEPYQGCYALTENSYGQGLAIYVGGGLDRSAHAALAQRVAKRLQLPSIESPEGLEVIERASEHGPLWLVLNHNHHAVLWRGHTFEPLAVRWLPAHFDEQIACILPSGEVVKRLSLQSPTGFKVEVITLGASLTEIWAKDQQGQRENVCLRYNRYEDYLQNPFYLGCTVGRTAGRIREGSLSLEGTALQLDTSRHPHALHGGPQGLSHVNWQVVEASPQRIHLRYRDAYSTGKTPGNLTVDALYALSGDEAFTLTYTATTDEKTYINLTNHVYFKLSEAGVSAWSLELPEVEYYPVDDESLPLGPPQPWPGLNSIDNAFVPKETNEVPKPFGPENPIVLKDPSSGCRLKMTTNQPSVVIYTGNYLSAGASPSGQQFRYQEAICLEAQDVPNRPNLTPNAVPWLKPGDTYCHETTYDFELK